MSCALWQFSPSGWSIGPYGAIQGHREEGDEEHISSISKTEIMYPWALVNHNLLLWKCIDYKWRQTFFIVAVMCDHAAQIVLSVPIHYLGHIGVHLKSKNNGLRQRTALSSSINKVNKRRTYFPTWLRVNWKMPEVPATRSARKDGWTQKTFSFTLLPNT